MPITTEETLARALEERLALTQDDAETCAERLVDLFGFEDSVLDARVEPEERRMLYALQEVAFVTTRSEEQLLDDGRVWRTHSWILRDGEVERAANARRAALEARRAIASARAHPDLASDAWARG